MSDQKACPTKFVNVDLDQWRRDINTFASTTHEALAAIVDEISNTVGGQVNPEKNKTRIGSRTNTRSLKTFLPSTETDAKARESKKPDANSSREDRLANLKERLAIRMAQAKTN